MKVKNILITGAPGCGKTTLVRAIAERLQGFSPAGFYTAEIRVNGIRQGFEIVSFSGIHRLLSHVTIKSPYRVGKYGVDITGFEEFLASLPLHDTSHPLIVIDEIGKMECQSIKFRRIVEETLASGTPSIATIAQRGDKFIEGIKKRDDVEIMHLSVENRDIIPYQVIEKVQNLLREKIR